MRRIVNISFMGLVFASLMCSGCKTLTLPTGKGYTELCQRYVGHESDKLLNAWGYPGRTFDAGQNEKVFVYVETRDEYTLNPLAHSALIEYPPRVDPRAGKSGETAGNVVGQSVASMDYCITYFEVDKTNRVVKAFWKGNCKALEATPPAASRERQ